MLRVFDMQGNVVSKNVNSRFESNSQLLTVSAFISACCIKERKFQI